MVFSSKSGLLAKYPYNIIQNPDGSLSIDYKASQPFIQQKTSNKAQDNFRSALKEQAPSLQEQKDFSTDFQNRNTNVSKDISNNDLTLS